jgi:repressor LexA
MTIGQRIKYKRTELKMSQDELAKKIGYKSRSSINKIELDIYDLQQSKIKDIADALQTTPSYLMGWTEDVDNLDIETTPIKVLGKVAAGVPIEAQEDVIDWEYIPKDWTKSEQYFGLRIQGDSMSPRISDGDTVIVRQQNDADSGDIVIVRINGDTATCKRLIKYAGGISLISFNPSYEPKDFTNKEIMEMPVEIIGKVVENRQKY